MSWDIPAGRVFPALPGLQSLEPPVSVTASVTVVPVMVGVTCGAAVSTAMLTMMSDDLSHAVSCTLTAVDGQ